MNENYNDFLGDFVLLMNESFPTIPIKPRNGKVVQWVTEGIKISSRNKRLIHRQMKVNNSAELKNYYKIYSRIFKNVVRAAKRKANDQFIKKSTCKSKASWKVIKNELGMVQKKKKYEVTEILSEGHTIRNP